ncbi:MAG TPA: OsmC family protein [Vicinamibacterales bacterium]
MAEPPRPLVAELVWSSERRFDASSGPIAFTVDGDTVAGPSPTQLLAVGLAACLSIDIVDIIRKGRHPLTSFAAKVTGQRLPTPPRRFVAFHLHLRVGGAVPEAAVARAVELSREKYCSVWHSLREDITLTTSVDILP